MATKNKTFDSDLKAKPHHLQAIIAWMGENRADLVLGLFSALITGLYALFMFRDRMPTWGLISLIGLWLLHLALAGWRRTPMDVPILALLGLSLFSLSISIDPSLTLPKVHGLILGAALFYVTVQVFRQKQRLTLALLGLLILAIGVSALSLVGTDWITDKVFDLPIVYNALPQLINNVPRSISDGGIHKNLVGGALTFFMPLLVSLLWDIQAVNFDDWIKNKKLAAKAKIAFIVVLILTLVLVTFTLVLTQSRGGYLGALLGILTLAVIKDRRYLWAIPLVLIALLPVIQRTAQGDLDIFLKLIDTTRGGTLPGRMEIWRRATLLIQDFPFTGAGMGTFSPLANTFYPFFAGSNPNIPHAHNMVLTIAGDLGVPGLVLYTALVSSFALIVIKTVKKAAPCPRTLLIGLGCGVLAHQVFGIMDAYMLGTKLGAIMWIYYGLAVGIFLQHVQPVGVSSQNEQRTTTNKKTGWQVLKPHLINLAWGCANWLLASLLAIAFININVIISLVLALLGGVWLGTTLIRRISSQSGSNLEQT